MSKTKIMIAIPCFAKLDTEFVRCLFAAMFSGLPQNTDVQVLFIEGSLTYDARNRIVDAAVSGNFDRVFWIDSDMCFEPDTLKKLNARMDEGLDYVSALAFRRKAPYKPVIYSKIGLDGDKPVLVPYEPYPDNALFEIAGSGFGCVMTSVKLLKNCLDNYGLPFSPRLGFGEDITLCLEANELGFKLYCDSSVKVGHIGQLIVTEEVYQHAKI